MQTAYRKTELFNRPAVSAEEAARNRAQANIWAKAGKRGNFCKPVHPRPAQRGVFPISRSTLDEWIRNGELPPPSRVGRILFWSADVIHAKLRELGLPAPADTNTTSHHGVTA